MRDLPPGWTLGASRVKGLMEGDLPRLWRVALGFEAEGFDPRYRLHAAIGQALEPLHVAWFTDKTGIVVSNEQDKVKHHSLPLHATLDGWVHVPLHLFGMPGRLDEVRTMPFEAKTTAPGKKPGDLIAREHAQLQAQMMCTNSTQALISILWRTPKWDAFLVEACLSTQQEIEERLGLLHHYLVVGEQPPELPLAITPEPRYRALQH